MSGSIPEESGSWLWPCCQDCLKRKACPYVYDQLLGHTARRGQAEAQHLTAEADRFLETISCANDISHLLDGSRDLEQALSSALHSEMSLINDLCAKTAQYCP